MQREEGPLYSKEEIARLERREKERTQYVADRAEERRRGVQVMDTQAMARLPEKYQQQQVDELNEAIENEHKQSEVPEGLTEAQFRRLLQMRTDGIKEEVIEKEMSPPPATPIPWDPSLTPLPYDGTCPPCPMMTHVAGDREGDGKDETGGYGGDQAVYAAKRGRAYGRMPRRRRA